jgi:hypothetical protein
MNENHQMPIELFNLVESKPWFALNENEKTIVLNHLSKEEYNNLHEMFVSTIALNQAEQELHAPTSIKQHLDRTFKKQHQKNIMIPLWQAAAVFVLMLGGFIYYSINSNSIEKVIVNTIHDTLYVPQIVSTEIKKTDTVIVYRYVNSNNDNSNKISANNKQIKPKESNDVVALPVSQIRTLSHEEIKNSLKNLKNKSMLEDTLYQKIGYASI